MATRLYFDSTTAASVSPAFGSGWGVTAEAVRLRLNRTQQASAMTDFTGINGSATDPDFVLAAQFVLPGLAAQTLSGTIKGQVRCRESASGLNATLAVRVAKATSDGSSVVEILAIAASDDISTTPPEFSSTLTNRRMQDSTESASITLSSTGISANDVLIVEIGYRQQNINTSRVADFTFGDDNASDLGENDTDTAALNPWIEFSANIAFEGEGGGAGKPYLYYARQRAD